ncbi:MAG: DNA polymerase/3'-5' exonuclease PolX [Sulfurospirillum sp.]
MISNKEIADIFNKLAELLEIQGYNRFKIIAYKNAAREIENLGNSLYDMVKREVDISTLPAIGEKIAKKIIEIVNTGKLAKLENLRKKFPAHILDLLKVEGIGPKRTKILHETLHISSLEELIDAARKHKIRELRGFGEKAEQKILDKTVFAKKTGKRFLYSVAEPQADSIKEYLEKFDDIFKVSVAGSFRRRKDTVGDLDMVASSQNPKRVIDYFIKYPGIKKVVLQGDTRSTVILENEIQVDFRCVKDESYGSALHYFTGSRAHVLAIRKMAQEEKLKINEYGIFKGQQKISGFSEQDIYKTMGFLYIQPELRENRGEFEAARSGKLPNLIKPEDLRGDLHMHTTYSDGRENIKEMAEASKKLGYRYIAITDHSKHLAVMNGMDEKRLRQQLGEIDRINEKLDGIEILKSIEVDILENGTLAMPNSLLKELDLVVGGIHDKFNLSVKKQTKRVLKAMDNPYFNILAHPTGRLINQREAYALDFGLLFEQSMQKGCFLEINSQPQRLDLNDIYVKTAKEMGVKFVISTDAHNIESLNCMKYGVFQARRGWLEKKDVINSLTLNQLKEILKR